MITKLKERLPYIDHGKLTDHYNRLRSHYERALGLDEEAAAEHAFFGTIDEFAIKNHILSTTDI